MSETHPAFELVILPSGQKSLRSRQHLQTFHPGIGPKAEARLLHVDQQGLVERAEAQGELRIWDLGFGAAANAIMVLEALAHTRASIELHSFDLSLEPLDFALEHAEELEYLKGYESLLRTLRKSSVVQVGSKIRWYFHLGDFRETMQDPRLLSPHAMLYDPYSARENYSLWTLEHFQKLFARLDPEELCLWTNYTRSTAVRCTLLLAGFYVGIGKAIGDKEQTTVASNRLEALAHPLPKDWLNQVRASQNANPLRGTEMEYGPISAVDLLLLEQHPQWQLV